jgi:hypothetical protein
MVAECHLNVQKGKPTWKRMSQAGVHPEFFTGAGDNPEAIQMCTKFMFNFRNYVTKFLLWL